MWTCTVCSYGENEDARTRCQLCEAMKPAGIKSTPAPTGPKWACSLCTLENSGSATNCIACGTAKPTAAPTAQPKPTTASAHIPTRPSGAAPTSSTAAKPKPTPSPPVATSSSSGAAPSESAIKFLESMGFDRARSIGALKVKPNQTDALDFLLNEDAAAEKAKPKPTVAKPTSSTASKPVSTTTPATQTKPGPTATAVPTKPAPTSSTPVVTKPVQPTTTTKPVVTPSSSTAKPTPAPTTTKPTPATNSATSVIQPLKQMSLSEKQAFEQREAKRLELLKMLEDEAAEKAAKAKAKAAAAASVHASSSTVAKKPTGAATTPKSSSSTSAPPSASTVSAASASTAPSTDKDNLTPEERKLIKIAEERAAEAQRVQLAKLRAQKRLEAESRLKDIPTVCRALQQNYDPSRYTAIIDMLRRIIDKVVQDKGVNEKFRKIPLGNPKLEQTILRPIGPIWILKQCGFVEEVVTPTSAEDKMTDVGAALDGTPIEEQRVLYLPAKKVNLKLLQQISTTLQQQLKSQSSNIPAIFNEIIQSKKYSIESIYLLAQELRLVVQNIVVSTDEIDDLRHQADVKSSHPEDDMSDIPSSSASSTSSSTANSRRGRDSVNKNFRTIDKHESFYINRIKPITESKKILAELGFVLDEHDLTKQFLVVPLEALSDENGFGVKKYQIILREINGIISQLQSSTPIALGLRSLCSKNRSKPTQRFMDLFITAIKTVLQAPHEQKYHKIMLDKVQAKVGTKPGQIIQGMEEFVQLFDFKPQPALDGSNTLDPRRVALTYPGFDVELLKWRLEELEQNWQQLLEQAADETGSASGSGWSFE